MDAISFLVKEHNKVRNMLADISDESHRFDTKRTMFEELASELIRHETMEQKVWYPKLKSDEKLKDIIQHLITEEKSAAEAIKELKKINSEEKWEEKFSQLKDDVEHHADEEEQKLFPKVEKIVEKSDLEELGKEMREFKKEYEETHR